MLITTPIFANRYETYVNDIQEDIELHYLQGTAKRTDFAIEAIIKRSVRSLRDQGFDEDADEIERDFPQYRNYLQNMVAHSNGRDIGDHKPLITWLAVVYELIEFKLGVEVCKALHISDLKTINYCIPVVFKPCTFDMGSISIPRRDEYRLHFASGKVYWGLVPVITYWAIEVGCLAATSGAGSFLCGLGATLGERVMGNRLAPGMSDWVFNRLCPT